jgi:hypothetical protein
MGALARVLVIGLGSLALALPTTVDAAPPRRAPAQFSTAQYGLTFRVSSSATYCPLPKDWVGSDHGTFIFLERPRRCGGAGYPSSGREFHPGNAARLELEYFYWDAEDASPEPQCHRVGMVVFLGKKRSVCETREHGIITRTVDAVYFTDVEAKAYFSLVTTPRRLSMDMTAFRGAAASFRTCSEVWHDSKDKRKSFTTGRGPRCPKGSRFF